MRVVLKECAWEPLGDELILVHDPREALTLADPDGKVEALLDELRKGPSTAAELSRALYLKDLTDGVDIVVGGLDSEPGAHLWVNEAALRAGIPLVGGGMQRTQFMYCSVDPGRSPCLLCDESDRPHPDEPTSAGVAQRLSRTLRFNNALIGPIAMQLGSLIAYEALRYLTGFEPPRAAGAQILLDLRTGLVPVWQPFPRDPEYPACALAVGIVDDPVRQA